MAFIGERSGKLAKRQIARAFGVRGADIRELTRLLAELSEEGQLDEQRRKLRRAAALPRILVADLLERDGDGELLAVPAQWDAQADGNPPKILVMREHHRPAAGLG